ncbi:MAG: HAMP domain-containing sensor histidine kinase [Planctomycetaceae bacterium]
MPQHSPAAGDQEDWDLEILQALMLPSTAEDAALACAAAWMNFVAADRVAVAVFDSVSTCIVAHGQRDSGHVTIYVGRENAGIANLLKPERLCGARRPCTIENPDRVLCWPEHLSVVMVSLDESAVSEERVDLLDEVSRRLLSRWTTPETTFASPDHMASMAEFAAGAGHEINNPLGSIIGQTQLLLKAEDRPEHRQALETIGAQAWRIRDMIGDTMLFARPPQPEFSAFDIIPTAQKVVANQNAASPGMTVRLEASAGAIPVFADEAQISTLMSHLIRNAIEACRAANVESAIVLGIRTEGDYAVSLSVTDQGPEIPVNIRRHLFDPFFSGRQAGRGLGFGLCHCWQIARMHNGLLTHQSLAPGNCFHVVIPQK